jgi:hypothetical protein
LGDFEIFKFIFGFPSKTIFFSQSKHTFVLPKKIWADNINK